MVFPHPVWPTTIRMGYFSTRYSSRSPVKPKQERESRFSLFSSLARNAAGGRDERCLKMGRRSRWAWRPRLANLLWATTDDSASDSRSSVLPGACVPGRQNCMASREGGRGLSPRVLFVVGRVQV